MRYTKRIAAVFCVERRAGRVTGNGEPLDCLAGGPSAPTTRHQPARTQLNPPKYTHTHERRAKIYLYPLGTLLGVYAYVRHRLPLAFMKCAHQFNIYTVRKRRQSKQSKQMPSSLNRNCRQGQTMREEVVGKG